MATPAVSSVLANTTSSIDTSSSVTGSILSALSISVGDVFKSAISYVIPENYAKGVGLVVSTVVIGGSVYMAYRDRQEAKRLLADEEKETKEGHKYNARAAAWALLALKEGVNVAVSLYFPQSTQLKADLSLAGSDLTNNISKLINETLPKPALNDTVAGPTFSENVSGTVFTAPPVVGTTGKVAELLKNNISDASLQSPLLGDLPQVSDEIAYPLEIFERTYNASALIRFRQSIIPVIKDVTNSSTPSNVSTYFNMTAYLEKLPKPVEAAPSTVSSVWSWLGWKK